MLKVPTFQVTRVEMGPSCLAERRTEDRSGFGAKSWSKRIIADLTGESSSLGCSAPRLHNR